MNRDELARKLALIHDMVMEVQEALADAEMEDSRDELLEGTSYEFYELVELIDVLEADTSELDCNFNYNYER